MSEAYPTRNGVAVSPIELGFTESALDLSDRHNFNNHHNAWSARSFGALSLFQTFRDLDRHQFKMPKDTHDRLHATYEPPEMPTVGQAMNVVMEAWDAGEALRKGSVGKFELIPVTLALIKQVKKEYNEVGRG